MSLSELITLLKAFFQFPETLLAVIKLLQDTPQERHEGLVLAMEQEKKKFDETGRPTWH